MGAMGNLTARREKLEGIVPIRHALKHEAVVSAVLLFVQVNLGFVLTHKRRGLSVERPEYSALPTSEL